MKLDFLFVTCRIPSSFMAKVGVLHKVGGMWTGSFFAFSLQHDTKEFQNWLSVEGFPCRCDVYVALAHAHLELPLYSQGRNNRVDLCAPSSATYDLLLPAWVNLFQLCLEANGCSRNHQTRDEVLDKLQPIESDCVPGKGRRSRISTCGLDPQSLVFQVVDQLLAPFTSFRLDLASFSKGFLHFDLF